MSDWISVEDRLPTVEGEYLVAYRSSYNREWTYLLDEWSGGDEQQPSCWCTDQVGSPQVEWWFDFPRVPQ